MAAKHVVLGLVVERSDYGYSLMQRLREGFGDAEFTGTIIYAALEALEKEELIEALGERRVAGSTRQAKSRMFFGATQEGVVAFDEWMAGPAPQAPMRDELRMKLALCQPRHVPALIDVAWAQEQQCLDRLKSLQAAEGVELNECSTLAEGLEALLLDADVAILQTTIEWLRRVRGLLRRLSEAHGGRPGPGLRGV